MAARRVERATAAANTRHDAQRNGRAEHETPSNYDQKRRDEAEAIRVANGGAPAQQRTYAVTASPAPTHDKARDDLLLLVIGKLRTLSVADLNEVNDLIDALTYPLRKQ